MKIAQNIFLEKKILIYGLGKSGISSFKFLKDLAQIYLFDDNLKINKSFNQKFINLSEITKIKVSNMLPALLLIIPIYHLIYLVQMY